MDEDVRKLLEKHRYSEALERLLNLYETKVFRMALTILRNPARARRSRRIFSSNSGRPSRPMMGAPLRARGSTSSRETRV